MNKLITQAVNIAKAENTPISTFETKFNPDTNYSKIVGIVVFNKGAHTNFDIGLSKHNGDQILAPLDHSFYGQTTGERYFPVEVEIDSNHLNVECSILEAQANKLAVQVGFILE